MNRNYLPPALKMQSPAGGQSQSPPASAQATSASASSNRRFGSRPCKLPTVQEVGKFIFSSFYFFFLFLEYYGIYVNLYVLLFNRFFP